MTTKGLLNSLNEQEWLLVAATERSAMANLDEDELVDLHTRVRRARTKYLKQYRRSASARVATAGGRGQARPQNRRAADKAELFEEALARVSSALAAAARTAAAELRSERLAAARSKGGSPPGSAAARSRAGSGTGESAGRAASSRPRGHAGSTKTPIARKQVASTQAAGARRQAKRDKR
jgi:hypothetical protein